MAESYVCYLNRGKCELRGKKIQKWFKTTCRHQAMWWWIGSWMLFLCNCGSPSNTEGMFLYLQEMQATTLVCSREVYYCTRRKCSTVVTGSVFRYTEEVYYCTYRKCTTVCAGSVLLCTHRASLGTCGSDTVSGQRHNDIALLPGPVHHHLVVGIVQVGLQRKEHSTDLFYFCSVWSKCSSTQSPMN